MTAASAVAGAIGAVLRDEAGMELAEYALVSAILGGMMIAAVIVIMNNAGAELDATTNGWTSVATTPP